MTAVNETSMVHPDKVCPKCNYKLPPDCPRCGSLRVTCNGKSGDQQKHRCSECGKQFGSDPTRRRIDDQEWRKVDSLLGDGVEVPIIHRAFGISKRHIYNRKSAMES